MMHVAKKGFEGAVLNCVVKVIVSALRNPCVFSTLMVLVPLCCQAQILSVGIYSGGCSYHTLSSTAFPFPPYNYELTLKSWRENAMGQTMDVNHKEAPGDVRRRSLLVECGSERFDIPLKSGAASKGASAANSPVVKEAGDLARLITQCAANRKGDIRTNGLPHIQATWVQHSRPSQDLVIVDGDRFAEVQKLLTQAWGPPEPGMSSSNYNARSVSYTQDRIGLMLNLTSTWSDTIISIVQKPKP